MADTQTTTRRALLKAAPALALVGAVPAAAEEVVTLRSLGHTADLTPEQYIAMMERAGARRIYD